MTPSVSADLFRRVARNIGWLVVSDGFRLASMVANLLLARFLGAANFGIVALARETARYATLPGDLGIATYGQAAAARCPEEALAALVDEIVPARGLIGFFIYGLFTIVCFCTVHDRTTIIVFLTSGLFVISETLRVDWLFRGREQFHLVVVARAVETVTFLLIVLLVGSRPDALIFDSAGWAASEMLMAAIWLWLLPSTTGRSVRLRVNFRGWLSHATEAIYIPIAAALLWGGWLVLLWIVSSTASHRDVGILAVPYSLTMSCVNLGLTLVMGFFPAAAGLARDSHVLAELRRALTSATLILGVPIAIVGTAIAKPLVYSLLGPSYRDSIAPFLLLIWLAPLYLVRAAYAYPLISSGFQRLFPLGSAVSLLTTVLLGLTLTTHYSVIGASVAALIAGAAATLTTAAASWACYGDTSLPNKEWLIKFALLNLALTFGGWALGDYTGWIIYVAGALVAYPLGIVGLELIDVRRAADDLFHRVPVQTSTE